MSDPTVLGLKPARRRRRTPWLLTLGAVGVTSMMLMRPPDEDSLLHQSGLVRHIQLANTGNYVAHSWAPDGSVRFLHWDYGSNRGLRARTYLENYNPETGSLIWSRKLAKTDWGPNLSPDGQWLTYDIGESGGGGKRKAVSADGTEHRFWNAIRGDGTGGRVWRPDGAAWVELGRRCAAAVTYPISGGPPTVYNLARQTSTVLPLWFDSTGRIVAYRVRRTDEGNQYYEPDGFMEIALAHQAHTRSVQLNMPPGSSILGAWLSPTENAVIWSLGFKNTRPAWLVSFLSFFGKRTQTDPEYVSQSIWVSRPDGSRMREIGRVKIGGKMQGVWCIRWDRTGDRISFVYDNKFYTLPVKL